MVNDKDIILPSFWEMWVDVLESRHTHYWLKGGRGSTKSSFISLALVMLMVMFPFVNVVVCRRYSTTLRDSVFEQVMWAIETWGLSSYFKATTSPLEIKYNPTGQKIVFKGADEPVKLKSTKFRKGYCAIIWFEELDQFSSMEDIRSILNSLRRGGDRFWVFYSYNPPKTMWSWVNKEALTMDLRADALVNHSTYLDVAGSHPEWIGQPFIDEAEIQKGLNFRAYEWEYLGVVTGTGGSVFDNLVARRITDEEIENFDNIHNGVDFGWFPDPWRFIRSNWKSNTRSLYIFEEHSANKKVPRDTGKIIVDALTYPDKWSDEPYLHSDVVWCDSADNTQINVYRRECGINARPARKGDMRKNSYIWLAGLREIVIDPERCPLTYEEFALCEYMKDKDGNWIEDFNDGNDHSIDAVRYSMMEEAIRGR